MQKGQGLPLYCAGEEGQGRKEDEVIFPKFNTQKAHSQKSKMHFEANHKALRKNGLEFSVTPADGYGVNIEKLYSLRNLPFKDGRKLAGFLFQPVGVPQDDIQNVLDFSLLELGHQIVSPEKRRTGIQGFSQGFLRKR
jgi:hypothetical protein